jgi:hypothetical protein
VVPLLRARAESNTISAVPASSFATALLHKDTAGSSGRCISCARTAVKMSVLVEAHCVEDSTPCEITFLMLIRIQHSCCTMRSSRGWSTAVLGRSCLWAQSRLIFEQNNAYLTCRLIQFSHSSRLHARYCRRRGGCLGRHDFRRQFHYSGSVYSTRPVTSSASLIEYIIRSLCLVVYVSNSALGYGRT